MDIMEEEEVSRTRRVYLWLLFYSKMIWAFVSPFLIVALVGVWIILPVIFIQIGGTIRDNFLIGLASLYLFLLVFGVWRLYNAILGHTKSLFAFSRKLDKFIGELSRLGNGFRNLDKGMNDLEKVTQSLAKKMEEATKLVQELKNRKG